MKKKKKVYKMKCCDGCHPRISVTQKFITSNKLGLRRTPEEVLSRIKSCNEQEFIGFSQEVLTDFIPYKSARELLTDEGKEKYDKNPRKWKQVKDIAEAAQDFLDYMVFAWMKAVDQRGISASRSVSKLGAWLWVMGREDLCELINRDDLFNPYGAPALIAVCEKMGIEVPKDVKEFAKHKCQ